MDKFHEEIIVKKSGRWINNLLYIFTWVSIILFGLMGLLGLFPILNGDFSVGNFVWLVIGGGVAFLLYRYKDNLNTEYEYTFTNGEMDFAKVLGNTRRKHLLTMRLKDVEAGGPAESDAFNRYSSMPGIKPQYMTLNGAEKQFFLYFIKDGKKHLLVLEPSETMTQLMHQANPRAILEA